MPEVSWTVAHAAIGEAVSNFLTLVLDPSDTGAQAYVDEKYNYTKQLLLGYLTSEVSDATWCETAQRINAVNVTGGFTTNTTMCSNFASFDASYPSLDHSARDVTVVAEVEYVFNPTDSSISEQSPSEIDCKLYTEAELLKEFNQNSSVVTEEGCMAANKAAMEYAFSIVDPVTLARYNLKGEV